MRPGQTIPSISPPQFSHPFRRYRLTLAEDTIRLGAPRLKEGLACHFPCVHRRGFGAKVVVQCTGVFL
ncbi:hypothetical protein CEXT_528411 [Caerostris extrusa]|uniref:Uncharacterized protein n=1 Tax=Caerostris extrusa TaxID=172846 RepID=A0AAV4PPV5_CAEEX|nr:hypothetical protein CEXT_528411 [Caerostris extrusa]